MHYHPANLVFINYEPKELKKGMLFLATLYEGTEREFHELWQYSTSTLSLEEHIKFYGFPVKPRIVYNNFVVEENNIGWLDIPYEEDMQMLSVKDMNKILNEFDGELEILVDEELFPHLIDDKVVIKFPEEE